MKEFLTQTQDSGLILLNILAYNRTPLSLLGLNKYLQLDELDKNNPVKSAARSICPATAGREQLKLIFFAAKKSIFKETFLPCHICTLKSWVHQGGINETKVELVHSTSI